MVTKDLLKRLSEARQRGQGRVPSENAGWHAPLAIPPPLPQLTPDILEEDIRDKRKTEKPEYSVSKPDEEYKDEKVVYKKKHLAPKALVLMSLGGVSNRKKISTSMSEELSNLKLAP